MGSALLAGLPVAMLEELAAHALQSKAVAVEAVVDELVSLAQATGVVAKIPEPWRAIVQKVERPFLEFVIRGLVEAAEGKLIAAGVLPPRPAT